MAKKPTYEELELRIAQLEEESAHLKRAEEVLCQSEERFREALDHVSAYIYMKDPQSRYVYANRSTLELFGCSAEELVGCDDARFFPPDTVLRLREVDSRVFAGERTSEEIDVVDAGSGRRVYWEVKTPIYAEPERKTIWGLLGISTDITERKRAEEALRESEENMRYIVKHDPNSIAVYDRNLHYIAVSDRYLQDYNVEEADIIGRHHYEVFPEMPQRWKDVHKRCLVGAIERNDDDYFERPDGSITYNRWECRPWYGAGGEIGGMITYTEVTTERKKAEMALRESQQLLERTFLSLHEAVFIVDITTYKILDCNPAASEIFGYSREEMLGRTTAFLHIDEDTLGEFRARLHSAVEEKGSLFLPEFKMKRKDGTVFPTEHSVTPLENERGQRIGWVSVVLDMTERKRAEEEREKLQTQFLQAQKMESVGRLAGGVAHDFNNQLGVIIGCSEMAMMKLDPENEVNQDLLEIHNAAQRSAEIVRQLLAFARKQIASPKVLDLNDTVSGTLKMLRRLIGEDIELAWIPGHELCTVKIDPSQVDQILANLAVNARDAIAGVGKVTIETATRAFDVSTCRDFPECEPGRYAMLSVSDNGIGMGKEILEHLFEPFFTTKEVGKGTGLGLSTIYGIVKQNNGFIQVCSEPGEGTSVRIYLPEFEGGASPPEEAKDDKITGGSETVLLAEDEGPLLNLARDVLEGYGYTVLAARTPGEALSLEEKHAGEIHLLVTDVVMPEMNGKELAERLRADHPNLRCLFMSGYTADVVAHHGVLNAGVHFIEKPFSTRALAKKVREVLDNPSS